jgi:methionyl-tRNA synthetase
MSRPRFYITTPIYYATDVPHLGHAYTTVVADALARYHRLRGDPTGFLTGTDEHGQKVARLAEEAGTSPKVFADRISEAYRAAWRALGISNDDFIRTTDADHEAVVAELWRTMQDKGDIYLGDYEGWYCVACEQFYTEKELDPGNLCAVHKRPVERIKEHSYYFRLSKYQEPLLAWFDAHPGFVQPASRLNEVRAFVKSGLQDLSVSRTTFTWGVPVPGAPGHVVYVWIDALANYYSATRRAVLGGMWDDDVEIVHLIGKEISRFHAVYWPAMLMSAGLRLPSCVFAHGWWTVDGEKMSKTLGNVVDPVRLSEDLGVDAFRYFVLREIPLGADGDFSHQALVTRYNAELANDLGNLLNRTLGMADKYFGGALPPQTGLGELRKESEIYRDEAAEAMDAYMPGKALERIWQLVRRANAYIDQAAPWSAAPARQAEILGTCLEMLRFLGSLIEPFMPDRAAELRRQIGCSGPAVWPEWHADATWRVEKPTPLFPRIDDDRKKALLEKWKPRPPGGAVTPAAPAGETIDFATFQKLDLRVAEVLLAEAVPKAKKLLRLVVSLGDEKRQVVAGIAERYRPAELVGKKVILLANLQPAEIRGVRSEGMILAAGEAEVLALSGLDGDVPAGTKVR